MVEREGSPHITRMLRAEQHRHIASIGVTNENDAGAISESSPAQLTHDEADAIRADLPHRPPQLR